MWDDGTIGMHSIKERPVVVNGQIVIRPIMVVALTYDHRLLDGREAVTFLGASCFLSFLLFLPPILFLRFGFWVHAKVDPWVWCFGEIGGRVV